ncbi:squalene/phytoene synthase family protein [Meridianimarinicoccus sp. MJW13]|uniref:squalene/phytoene synthase family protein n=1 Tax=Meridianimarinicoccus sp. MJW13 TaxID=2720031 RepID=UPI0018684978|nr:squalene/phytoene synthase family protein [Fluviibacterium sp. MJW13]
MSLQACADVLERGDPDRFRAVLAAPVAARPVLLPLYAFNLEVARAPWVSAEVMIGEMRLQWWRDLLDEIVAGGTVRKHEVATPLSGVLDADGAKVLIPLVEARRLDLQRDPFEDRAAFDQYLQDTSGALFWTAGRALGAQAAAEPVFRDAGQASGLAAWLLAVPELEARGRVPLPDGRAAAVQALARDGLGWLVRARQGFGAVDRLARSALLSGWRASVVLGRAAQVPGRVADGQLAESEAARRLALLRASMTRRI